MRRTIVTLSLAVGLAVSGAAAWADGEFEKQIKARTALMQLYSFNLGHLGGMAKEKIPYDADSAVRAADSLLAAVKMDQSRMWPAGSDATALPGKTRAKAEAWESGSTTKEKHQDLVDAATAMAANAGNGLDGIKKNIGAVGEGCKGCHKAYREKKD